MTIKLDSNNTKLRKLVPKDDDFCIQSGYAYYPRAVIDVSNDCPINVAEIVREAMKRGWIVPAAYVKDSEYMWEKLSDNAS